MQLPLNDARAVRMIQALFAAADPLARLETGGSQRAYDALAVAVLSALREGARVPDVILLLSEHAKRDPQADAVALGPVVRFAQAVADWWVNAEGRWAPDSALLHANESQDGEVVAGVVRG